MKLNQHLILPGLLGVALIALLLPLPAPGADEPLKRQHQLPLHGSCRRLTNQQLKSNAGAGW